MNPYRTSTAKRYSFLVIDTTLPSDYSLLFRKNLLETIQKLIMTIDDKIRNEKLQYDVNRQAARISALSSSKIEKYKFHTGGEPLPSEQSRIIEKAIEE